MSISISKSSTRKGIRCYFLIIEYIVWYNIQYCRNNIEIKTLFTFTISEKHSLLKWYYSILKIEYLKDRVESFDDYYPCNRKRRDCDNGHVYNWIELDLFHTRITSYLL